MFAGTFPSYFPSMYRTAVVATCALIGLTACSSVGPRSNVYSNNPFKGPGGFVHPQIGPMNYSSKYQYDNALTDDSQDNDPAFLKLEPFDLSLARAERLDNQLYNAMWRNDTYGFLTGIGMFGAGIATLAAGVLDASRTILLAGGLTTAGFAGVRAFYPFATRNQLYSKGRIALQCAVESTQTAVDLSVTLAGTGSGAAHFVGPESLNVILANASHAASQLQRSANAAPAKNNVSAEVARQLWIQSANTSANSILAAVASGRALQAQVQPEVQAATLNSIVSRIHALVDAQADALMPNPEAALRAASAQLESTLSGVQTTGLKARQAAQAIDNQKATKEMATAARVATNQPDAAKDGEAKKEADANARQAMDAAGTASAKAIGANKEAVVAAKDAADANHDAATATGDGARDAAAKAKSADEAGAKADAARALARDADAMARAAGERAADAQAAADAVGKDPIDNATYWTQVLAARMDAIAAKLKNIDSCTGPLTAPAT